MAGKREPKIIQECKGIDVQDGKSGERTFVSFDTDYGVISIAMDDGWLGLLVSLILQHANSRAAPKSGTHDSVPANLDPIKTQAISIEKGPTPDTVYVAFLMGNVNVTFIVKKSAVQATYARVASKII